MIPYDFGEDERAAKKEYAKADYKCDGRADVVWSRALIEFFLRSIM